MKRNPIFVAFLVLHEECGAYDCIIPDYLCNITPMLPWLVNSGLAVEGIVVFVEGAVAR